MPGRARMACLAWATIQDCSRLLAPLELRRRLASALAETYLNQGNNWLRARVLKPCRVSPIQQCRLHSHNPCDQTMQGENEVAAVTQSHLAGTHALARPNHFS